MPNEKGTPTASHLRHSKGVIGNPNRPPFSPIQGILEAHCVAEPISEWKTWLLLRKC
jgi:hypothetical protein